MEIVDKTINLNTVSQFGNCLFRFSTIKNNLNNKSQELENKLILESEFNIGDPVVVSDEFVFGIGIGFITNLHANSITLSLDRDIEFNDEICGMKTYRIDKDVLLSGSNTMRENLLKLMLPLNNRLRELIIDLKEPEFDNNIEDQPKLAREYSNNATLNDDQIYAISKSISS